MLLVILRLPCLATGTPAAAITMGRRRTDIERMRTIAPGAAGVQDNGVAALDADHRAAHGTGRADQVVHRFAPRLQRCQELFHVRGTRVTGEHATDDLLHQFAWNVGGGPLGQEKLESLGYRCFHEAARVDAWERWGVDARISHTC